MVNDLTTVEGAAQEVIDHLEQHLTNKGVIDAQFNPVTGIIGLVDRIPDIEPSVNINLTIDLSLTSSASTINYGESVLLTATLLASYEGVSEVDLQTGEITGATILFKNGSTIIGTGTTDSNGVATLTYTPTVSETTLSINAVFEGTDNFNRASSNNVSIEVNDYIDLTSDKDILSYVDGDEAVLTATLYSPDKIDKTVTFEVRKQSDDSLIETLTAVTDNSGIATVGYTSKHANLLNIKAISGSLSDVTQIDDLLYYNNGDHVTGMTIDNGVSCTSNGSYITITTNTNSEKYVKIPISIDGDWEYSIRLAKRGTSADIQWQINNNSHYGSIAYARINGTYQYFTISPAVGDVLTIQQKNGAVNILYNNTQQVSFPNTNITLSNCGFYINPNRTIHVNEIKIRQL